MTEKQIKKTKAYKFAEKKHKGQLRKDGEEYITHPLNVALILINDFSVQDNEIIRAALLHDTIEDTETTYEEIQSEFGKNVADYVLKMTKPEDKQGELEYWKNLPDEPENVLKIKIADRIHNLSTSDFSKLFQDKYIEKTKKHIMPVAEKLGGIYLDKLKQTMQQVSKK